MVRFTSVPSALFHVKHIPQKGKVMRVFKRLEKAAEGRKRTGRVLGWAGRLKKLEEALIELQAFQVRAISQACLESGREPSSQEADFLAAAEDFRAHVVEVLNHG